MSVEKVAFISTELGDDLVVSFAIADPTNPAEVESLTLLRTPQHEALLPPEERGVSVSFDRFVEVDDRNLLTEVRFSKKARTLHLESRLHRYDLDLGDVDPDELAEMIKVFHKMNSDGCFRAVGL